MNQAQDITPEVGGYYVAKVVGFQPGMKPSELRVKVTRVSLENDTVWVRTADMRDAGTPLVLSIRENLIKPAD